MNALRERRQGWRCESVCRLGLPVWLLLSACCRGGPDPSPPDPVRSDPSPPPAAVAPDPLPDRPRPETVTDRNSRPVAAAEAPPDPAPGPRPAPAAPAAPAANVAPAVRERPASPPGLLPTTDAEPDPRLEAEFRSRRSLNHVLYRDRRYRLLIDEASQLLTRGESLAAFDLLLEIAAAEEDVFLWDDRSSQPVSARRLGNELLQRLPDAEQARYERYAGAAAAAALATALSTGDLDALLDVARRYPATAAGRRATRCVAMQLFDSGRVHESVALWRTLLTASTAAEITPGDRAHAALVAAAAGDANLSALAGLAPDAAVAIHGVSYRLEEGQTRITQDWSQTAASAIQTAPGWTMPAGAVSGSRSDSGTAPYHIPLWSHALQAAASDPASSAASAWQLNVPVVEARDLDESRQAAERWYQTRLDDGEPPATAALPLVVGETVILREPRGLVGRNLQSGAIDWMHRCRTGLDGTPLDDSDTASAPGYSQVSAENSLLLTLTSDGQRVYFIDDITETVLESPSATAPEPTAEPRVATAVVNRLTAIRLPGTLADRNGRNAARAETAWSVGGPLTSTHPAPPLAGHFFLGPPLIVGSQLLVLTESCGQIHLSGLDPETGTVLFLQGLSLVDRAVSLETDRLRLAFLPAVVGGLAVCPTPSGALIAYDLNARALAWTAQYRALESSISTSWRGDGRAAATLYPVQPVLTDERVLMLPPDSVELMAFDLADGARCWSLPRRGGHQLLATARQQVLLLSTERVTCCDVLAGKLLWERAVESLCGRGVLLGDTLLAPQQNGQLLRLDAATGAALQGGPEVLAVAAAPAPFTAPLFGSAPVVATDCGCASSPQHRLGNLVVAGDWMVSASPVETTVYVQSARLLSAVAQGAHPPAGTVLADLVQSWSPQIRTLRLAELELTLGHGAAALPHLQQLAVLPDGVSPRARQLLRELLYSQLEQGSTTDIEETLDQLASLADTPVEAARQRVAVLRRAAATGDLNRWLATAEVLAALPPDLLVPADVARSLQLLPATLIDRSRDELLASLSAQRAADLAVQVAQDWNSLADSRDPLALQNFIQLAGDTREADRARLHLSRLLADSGCKLASEHWLLPIQRPADSTLGGLRQRALGQLERARPARVADVLPAEFVTARRPAAHPLLEPAHDLTRVAFHLQDDPWQLFGGRRAEISVQPLDPAGPTNTIDLSAVCDYRRELSVEPTSRLRIINLGDPRPPSITVPQLASGEKPENVQQVELAIVRRDNATVLSRLLVPARCKEPQLHFQPDAGHFLPLADHEVHGLSLLDGCRLWSVAPAGGDRSERVRLGPNGPGYCIVQTTAGVCCLDPLTGRVRWQRRDVAPDAGLYAHEEAGLFGDSRQLVILESDQRVCRIVATDTGECLATAELPTTDLRRSRFVFGSRLFLVAEVDGAPRVRLWDAATQSVVFDEPAHLPVRHYRVDRHHAAFVAASGEVVVVDTRVAAEVVRHAIDPALLPNLTGVSVWSDADHWYVHTSHSGLPAGGGRTEAIGGEVLLPSVAVNGILSAYTREGRRRLWSRPFESRTLLLEPNRELPFLVTLWRNREGLTASSASVTIELLDKKTGDVVAHASNIERKRFVHSALRPAGGEYELFTEAARIVIRYDLPPPRQIMTAENHAEQLTP